MKQNRKYILIILLAAVTAALIYWQANKKQIIRHAIQSAVQKESDSTYAIRYDSSSIDEVGGNATFYNLQLQSDSLFRLLQKDSAALSSTIISIFVKKLEIRGADIPGLLSNNIIQAREINIESPEIFLVLPPGDSIRFSREDSIKLYERLTGNFNLLKVGKIEITKGSVYLSKGLLPVHTTIKGIDLKIKDLNIDSTQDHNNLVSYFIKDMEAQVDSVILLPKKSDHTVLLTGIGYSAPGRYLHIKRFHETKVHSKTPVTEILNTGFANLSTDAFINRHEINADTLFSSGGKIQIDINKGEKEKDITKQIIINNDYFNKIHIKNLRLGRIDITIMDQHKRERIARSRGLTLEASDIDALNFSFNIPWILNHSNWVIKGDALELTTNHRDYKPRVGRFVLNKPNSSASFEIVELLPVDSDEAFMRRQRHQKDHYRILLSNLQFSGVQFDRLLQQRTLSASGASVQPDLCIFNDRTLPPDLSSKVGKYPQQMLQQLTVPVSINRLLVRNGKVVYRERGAISKKTGDVAFTRINATVSNFSNLKQRFDAKSEMVLEAEAYFLGITPLKTTWRFPMHEKNGSFSISATIGQADATKFNTVTEPLGMAKIKSGQLKGLQLNMKGDDYGSAGSATVLYNDLKLTYLEEPKGKDTINKKNLLTFFANIFTKDDNPSNGKTRSNSVGIPRDTTRSFFNLVWKSIFEGVKKTAAGKAM